jgi:DNA repair protein RecO (recombination protein O)
MPIHKTEAIVLNRRNFRETSLIADFYTRDFGKISGLLKGMRADPRKFASSVEIFSCNEVIFYEKRTSTLNLVSQCDIRDNFDHIRRDIFKVGIASFMMELINAVMQPEDKNEDIFNLSLDCLSELKLNPHSHKIVTIFKIKMLALSGFKPHFDSCVICLNKISGQSKFSLMLGGLLCPNCYKKDLAARTIFRGTVASILHIERSNFATSLNLGMNPQIKRELDMILSAFLNFHLGKELKSQKVMSTLGALVPALK